MTDKIQWHQAVKNSLTDKKKWHYVLLYDFDDIQLTEYQLEGIHDLMDLWKSSYILRKSSHGYHLIGLTPMDSSMWGNHFFELQESFPTYHDGQAIRISEKELGEFVIIQQSLKYPFSLNLFKLFSKERYVETDLNAIKELWYVLISYTTNKQNMKNKEVVNRRTWIPTSNS